MQFLCDHRWPPWPELFPLFPPFPGEFRVVQQALATQVRQRPVDHILSVFAFQTSFDLFLRPGPVC
ncbi:uncharacterized protein METZ01_LOCUS26463 [marine metagenome]|uniref:Uncharacterized protein n=1 Tax=marine metagenome TaxID=408172 RepID=A0A381Q5J1_9ZZZZ